MTYKLPLNLIFSFEIFDMTDFAPFESESRLILDSLYRVDRIRVRSIILYCNKININTVYVTIIRT